MTRYPAKQIPTADPKLIPKPSAKLTTQLVEETVHGHNPIHGRSVNPGLSVSPLGERILLVTVGPLGAPRKGERKGEGLKPRGRK